MSDRIWNLGWQIYILKKTANPDGYYPHKQVGNNLSNIYYRFLPRISCKQNNYTMAYVILIQIVLWMTIMPGGFPTY